MLEGALEGAPPEELQKTTGREAGSLPRRHTKIAGTHPGRSRKEVFRSGGKEPGGCSEDHGTCNFVTPEEQRKPRPEQLRNKTGRKAGRKPRKPHFSKAEWKQEQKPGRKAGRKRNRRHRNTARRSRKSLGRA